MKLSITFATIATLFLFAFACASARRSEPIAGPLDTTNGDVEHGELVFARHCHACHVGGEGGLGPALNDKPLPRFAVRAQVRQGLGAMPAFDANEIDDRDLDDLTEFVSALRAHGTR